MFRERDVENVNVKWIVCGIYVRRRMRASYMSRVRKWRCLMEHAT